MSCFNSFLPTVPSYTWGWESYVCTGNLICSNFNNFPEPCAGKFEKNLSAECLFSAYSVYINNNDNQFYIALFTPKRRKSGVLLGSSLPFNHHTRKCQLFRLCCSADHCTRSASNIITPGHWALINSFYALPVKQATEGL